MAEAAEAVAAAAPTPPRDRSARRPAMVAARDGTNRAPFPQVSKDPELQMWEEVGSPGWARTSDFLINSPSPRRSTRTHHDLSARHLWHSLRGHLLVDGGSPSCVGTNVEPAQRSHGAVDVEPLRESLVRPD